CRSKWSTIQALAGFRPMSPITPGIASICGGPRRRHSHCSCPDRPLPALHFRGNTVYRPYSNDRSALLTAPKPALFPKTSLKSDQACAEVVQAQALSRILEIVTWLPEQLSGSTQPRVLASF